MASYNLLGNRARRLLEHLLESPGLVLLVPLSEQSGAPVDWSPSRISATLNGSPTFSTAIGGHFYGWALDGSSDYANLGDVAALSFERTDAFSVMCLINPNVSALGGILAKVDNSNNRGWSLALNATRTIRLKLTNTATSNDLEVRSTDALANGTAVMALVTYDGSSSAAGVDMYVDGVAVTTTTVLDTLSATIDHAVAAAIAATPVGFNNLVANGLAMVTAWNRALSAAEARQLAYIAGFL